MRSYHRWLLEASPKLAGVRHIETCPRPLYNSRCRSAKQDDRPHPFNASLYDRLLAYVSAWVSRTGVAARRQAAVAPVQTLPVYLIAGKSVPREHKRSK